MTNENAKWTIEEMYNYWKQNGMTFSETKALEKAKQALDKQIAMKPTQEIATIFKRSTCPSCLNLHSEQAPYCCFCGQKLDWD
jgi:RNase P subunit RPR2